MKATVLLGTPKKTGVSNTETLYESLSGRVGREGVGVFKIVTTYNRGGRRTRPSI